MKKKRLAVLLATLLLLPGAISAQSAEELPYEQTFPQTPTLIAGQNGREIIQNANLEILGATGFYQWGIVGGAYDEKIFVEEPGKDSKFAVRIKSKSSDYAHILQGISEPRDVVPGETYEISAWGKRISRAGRGTACIELRFMKNNTEQVGGIILPFTGTDVENEVWTKKICRFVLPEGTRSITVMARAMYGAEIAFDDISLLTTAYAEPEVPIVKEPAIGSENLFANGDFSNGFSGWGYSHPLDAGIVSIDQSGGVGGTPCAKFTYDETGKLIWIGITNTKIEPGATYQAEMKVRAAANYACSMSFGYEYNFSHPAQADKWSGIMDHEGGWFYPSDAWQTVYANMTVPPDCLGGMFRVRYQGIAPGTVFYIDDVKFYKIREAPIGYLEQDEIFNYTEWGTGEAYFGQFKYSTPLDGKNAEFALLDGETVLESRTVPIVNKKATFHYEIAKMATKGKEYTIRAKVRDGETVLFEDSKPVYRYDRPTYLNADGTFEKNGQKINWFLGDSVNLKSQDYVKELKITVAHIVGSRGDTRDALKQMDDAWERGYYVLVTMYSGMKSAGHPDVIEGVKNAVRKVKDHPATLGYKIQDEPFGKGNSDEELRAAYKAIRDIDPDHPIYTDDSGPGNYNALRKYCDIMDIDYYAAGSVDRGTVIGDRIGYAVEVTKGKKPVSYLSQAFDWGTQDGEPYFPTADEFRHYAYQVFFSGGSGYGFHQFTETGLTPERPAWEGLVKWCEWEKDLMFDCFVNQKYPQMGEEKTDSTWWQTYVKDGKILLFVINRLYKQEATATVTLTDFGNTLNVQGFSAKRIAGGTETTVTGSGDALTLTLPGMAAEVYEITPSTAQDYTGIADSSFRDLMEFPFARPALAALEEKGVVNAENSYLFYPERPITRGEMAELIIPAFGFTNTPNGNFADVMAYRSYADEIAVGKAAGLFTGAEDAAFNPDGVLSRDTLRAIVKRAAELKSLPADTIELETEMALKECAIFGRDVLDLAGPVTRAEAAVVLEKVMRHIDGTAEETGISGLSASHKKIITSALKADGRYATDSKTWIASEESINLVKNPSFEEGTATDGITPKNWTVYNEVSSQGNTADFFAHVSGAGLVSAGNTAFRMCRNNETENVMRQYLYQRIPKESLTVGKKYRVSYDIYIPENDYRVTCSVTAGGFDRADIGYNRFWTNYGNATNTGYKSDAWEFTYTQGGQDLYMVFNAWTKKGAVYIDNVSIVEAEMASEEGTDTSYALIYNAGDTPYANTLAVPDTFARIVADTGEGTLTETGDGFAYVVAPHSLLLIATTDTEKPGIYEGNVAANVLFDGAVYRDGVENTGEKFGVLYRKVKDTWMMVRILTPGDTVTFNEDYEYCFKLFSWGEDIKPVRIAEKYINKK